MYISVPALQSGVPVGYATIAIRYDGSIGVKNLIIGTSANSAPTWIPSSVTGDFVIVLDSVSHWMD